MWNAAGEACTTRQGRRLFPLFASAGIAGGIVGNGLTGPLASLLGTENLLLVQAALLVAGGVTARMVGGRFFRDQPRELGTSTASDLLDGLHLTRRRPLLRHMTWAAGLLSLVFFIVVFPFAEVVTQSFPSEVEMAGFLGLFSALATGGTFLVSLLAANRLFAKLGVVTTLLVVPVVYVVGFSIWLVSFGIATAVLVRGCPVDRRQRHQRHGLECSVQRRTRPAAGTGHGLHGSRPYPTRYDGIRRFAHRRFRTVDQPDDRARPGACRGSHAPRATDAPGLHRSAGPCCARGRCRGVHPHAARNAEASTRRRRSAGAHRSAQRPRAQGPGNGRDPPRSSRRWSTQRSRHGRPRRPRLASAARRPPGFDRPGTPPGGCRRR